VAAGVASSAFTIFGTRRARGSDRPDSHPCPSVSGVSRYACSLLEV
jgi:hypothetical protein